jgi:hypothetical protein
MPKIKDLNLDTATKKRVNFLELISPDIRQQLIQQTDNQTNSGPMSNGDAQSNRQQSGNKVATNRQQSGNKVATNRKQHDAVQQQSGNKVATQPATKLATKWQQSGNKVATKCTFSSLVGLQRAILIFIYLECKNLRTRETMAITLEHMAKSLERSTGAIKTTLQRLEKKKCIVRPSHKNGRGGWSTYGLPDELYQEMIMSETGNKVATNWQQSGNKVATQPATQPATSLPSSSSSSINKITTTEKNFDGWEFDISGYKYFGFTATHVNQLKNASCVSPQVAEQSLLELDHDLKNNTAPKITSTPLNFIMGLLRNGNAYVSVSFRSEQERAVAEMSARAKEKSRQLEEESFFAWLATMSDEEKMKIADAMHPSLMVEYRVGGLSHQDVKNHFMAHFKQAMKETAAKPTAS